MGENPPASLEIPDRQRNKSHHNYVPKMASSIDKQPPHSFPKLFIQSQLLFRPRPPPSGTDLSGQVAMVTGANQGMGLECSRQLLGHRLSHLVMAVRNQGKGEAEAAKLRASYPGATVSVWQLDMVSYASIQAFARRVDVELPRLDIVILNAGVSPGSMRLVPESGHEETIQVNYLSTMLLAVLLLPLLRRKRAEALTSNVSPAQGLAPPRVSIVSSRTSGTCKFANRDAVPLLASFDDKATSGPYDMQERYGVSKLLGQMFVYKLARDWVSGDDVTVNLAEPGLVKGTQLFRDLPAAARLAMRAFMSPVARTPKQGVYGYLDAALVQGKESHGSFVDDREIKA